MYLVGTLGLILPSTQPYLKLASPFNLWVSVILLLLFHPQMNKSFILISMGIFLAGFFIEVIGVQSGLIFGKYWYGKTLGTKLMDVPVVIGANWLLLIYCSNIVTLAFFESFKKNKLKKSLLDYTVSKAIFASFLMVCLDYLIEPVAIHLDFWHWQFEKIPSQNFQAWFIIAFLLSCLFLRGNFKKSNPLATLLFALQFLFFFSINIFKMLF
jgi:putative membrane protein